MSKEFDPPDLDSFNAKWKENYKLTGFGIEGMRYHIPCSFCAESGFAEYSLLNMYEVMSKEITCEKCGRTSVWSITGGFRATSAVSIRQVQTAGDTAPRYLPYGTHA